jgi:hypothetical protein
MTTIPTMSCGEVLVIFEGAPRVTWCRSGLSSWRPTGLWPTPAQRTDVLGRLTAKRGVLVLLESGPPTVAMLSEEFVGAPESIRTLAIPGDQDDDPVTLRIPLLDWLPEHLRARGLAFHRWANDASATFPRALLPPLLLEPVDPECAQLRFRLQLAPCSAAALSAAARHAFVSLATAGASDVVADDLVRLPHAG